MDGISSFFEYVGLRQEDIIESTLAHARMSIIVIALATVFSVLLAVAVQRHPTARAIALAITGVFLTLPSLALFALFIPLVGIGNLPAMVALFMYAILPILRNTVTGLDEVPSAVVESARGMGMSNRQQLLKVRLPLAWPLIMTGIRISSLMVVSIASIAVLVGGDGLGEFIFGGITRLGLPNSVESIWIGIVFTVLLGLVLDTIFAIIQRFTTPRGLRA